MKEILIDGEIGYDWWDGSGNTGKTVAAQLEGLTDGEEVRITLNSPGGSVYDGAVIFNLLRETAKTHPVSVRINSIAMSMGSYIALAARTLDVNAKISVTDNSVFMIHNPWSYSAGDYRVLKKEGEYLEKLASMLGLVYQTVSGKTAEDITALMNEETFYVGKEIFDAGFANDYEPLSAQTESEESGVFSGGRDTKIINAKLRFDEAMKKAREAQGRKESKNDLMKAAAFYKGGAKPKTEPAEARATRRRRRRRPRKNRGGFQAGACGQNSGRRQ